MGAIFGFLFPILLLLLLVLLGAGVYGFTRGRLSLATIVHVYAAVVLGICLVLALSGVALTVKSLSGSLAGLDFSYQTTDYPPAEPPPGVNVPRMPAASERAAGQARDDLASGIALIVIGSALGALHAAARSVAARRDVTNAGAVARGFEVAMLLVSAAIGLASSALLLNALVRRYLVTGAPADPFSAPRPGGPLGFALAFAPLWIIFARRVWRALNAGGPPAVVDAPSPTTTAE